MHCTVLLMLYYPAGSPRSDPALFANCVRVSDSSLTGCSERGEAEWFRRCAAHLHGSSRLDRGGSAGGECLPKPVSKLRSGSVCLPSPRMTSGLLLLVSAPDPEMLVELPQNSLSAFLPAAMVESITFASA